MLTTRELLRRGAYWIADQTASWGYGKVLDAVTGQSFEKELNAGLADVRAEARTLQDRIAKLQSATAERERLNLEAAQANLQQLQRFESAITTQILILRRLMDGKVDRAEAEQRHREVLEELQRLEATQDATNARVAALEERVRRIERSGASVTDATSTTVVVSRSPSRRDLRTSRQLVRNGDQLLARGATREAIEAYDRALVLDRDSTNAYAGRAKAHERLQSYDDALHDLRSAMSRDESRQDLLLIRAGIYRKLREFDKAIADYTTFLNRARHYPEKALYGRGCAYVEAGNTAAAVADYSACVSVAPASGEAQSAGEMLRKLAAR